MTIQTTYAHLRFLLNSTNSVPPAKVQQRRALGHADFPDLADKDGVVAPVVGIHYGTIQIGQRILEDRRAALHGTVLDAETIGGIVVALGIGEKFRQRFLLLFEHAHSKLAALADVKVRLGQMVNAD